MSAVGGVADVDFGLDAGFGFVALGELFGKGFGLVLLDQIHRAAAEAAAGEPRADQAG